MMERAVESRRAKKAQLKDHKDLFPATKAVLDQAGEVYGETFRSILRGKDV